MRCKKCHKYSPGYYCSFCSRTKSGGTKPLDVALKKLDRKYPKGDPREIAELYGTGVKKFEDFLKEKHESKNNEADSLPEDCSGGKTGEGKNPVESD